jgi:hypothetical protein
MIPFVYFVFFVVKKLSKFRETNNSLSLLVTFICCLLSSVQSVQSVVKRIGSALRESGHHDDVERQEQRSSGSVWRYSELAAIPGVSSENAAAFGRPDFADSMATSTNPIAIRNE